MMEWLIAFSVPILFVVTFLVVATVGDRKRIKRLEQRRIKENTKMFEAQMRGELYIPQPGPLP